MQSGTCCSTGQGDGVIPAFYLNLRSSLPAKVKCSADSILAHELYVLEINGRWKYLMNSAVRFEDCPALGDRIAYV